MSGHSTTCRCACVTDVGNFTVYMYMYMYIYLHVHIYRHSWVFICVYVHINIYTNSRRPHVPPCGGLTGILPATGETPCGSSWCQALHGNQEEAETVAAGFLVVVT